VIDLTTKGWDFTPGATNRISYRGTYKGGDPKPKKKAGEIVMAASLALYY